MKINSLILTLALSGQLSAITPEAAQQLVGARLTGKYQSGHCTEYALALGNSLERLRVPYARIHYTWWDAGKSAMHVIIFYRTDGNSWLADNENSHPVKVSGHLTQANARNWITAWNSPFGGPQADIGSIYIAQYGARK